MAERRKAGADYRSTTPSRFLEELPQEELEWLGRRSQRSVQQKKQIAGAHLANLRALLNN